MLKKNGELNAGSINLIGASTKIRGELLTEGDVRIDGAVEGDIHSQAKVVLGTSGHIDGNVHCESADISGTVEGNVICKNLLHLKADARVMGDILTQKLVIEQGAAFNGTCEMDGKLSEDKIKKLNGRQQKTEQQGSDGGAKINGRGQEAKVSKAQTSAT